MCEQDRLCLLLFGSTCLQSRFPFFCDKELSYLLGRLDFVINYVFDALVCTKHGDMQLQLSIPKFALMF